MADELIKFLLYQYNKEHNKNTDKTPKNELFDKIIGEVWEEGDKQ